MLNNLNPDFKGKFDINNDLVAFLDESGDEGFKFETTTCSKWFVVGGIILTHNESNSMVNGINEFILKYCSNKPINKTSFKELSHNQRKNLLGILSKYNYQAISSAFYKPKIDPSNNLCTYPSMYFVAVKNLIERLTWVTNQFNKKRVHILISNRNSISSQNLQQYLFVNSINANKNLFYKNNLGMVCLSTPNNNNKLLLADYASSCIFHALEKTSEAQVVENIYCDIFLKGRMYSSNHKKYGGVWKNGFKCTPDDKGLIDYLGILEEGSGSL